MDFDQEPNENESDDKSIQEKAKQWFQDNVRIIISILIVVSIAGIIYSYSKRTEAPIITENITETAEKSSTDTKEDTENKATKDIKSDSKETIVPKNDAEKTSSIATSQETEKSFIETAVKGDSQTKLARKALANFLEKNPDSELKAEHKIYIEDYLRKNANHKGRVSVGTSIEFSKDLINDAITKSKKLNDKQLQNLHKYVVRVPSIS